MLFRSEEESSSNNKEDDYKLKNAQQHAAEFQELLDFAKQLGGDENKTITAPAKLSKNIKVNINDLPNGLDSVLESGSELMSAASVGQIRKVAIARALAHKPKLLIADEPTADLDRASANRVMSTLRSLKCGVIVITHDVEILNETDNVMRIEK